MIASLATIIAAFLTGVLGPVAVVAVKYYIDRRKKKPDMIAEALEVSERVMVKLDHVREEFDADRVWIAQFHNGGYFYPTGKSIAKFSIVYETVSSTVSSIQANFRNIPVSLFSKSINRLLEADAIAIADFKDETIATYGLKYIAEESGCKSGYLFAVKTIDDKFVGILGMDYTRKKCKLTEYQLHQLFNHATSVGGELLSHLEK
jgi:hypothetical protein